MPPKKKTPTPAEFLALAIAAFAAEAKNGATLPLAVPARKTDVARKTALAKAVRERRDAGGRLGRWEVVRYSAEATTGRRVSDDEIRALYAAGGGDLATSYTGRGTRAGAKATRADATAETRA